VASGSGEPEGNGAETTRFPFPLPGVNIGEEKAKVNTYFAIPSMDSDRLKQKILENAAEIARLHKRIHETFAVRLKSPDKRRDWEQACAEFHARYNGLAFPGGYGGALERIIFFGVAGVRHCPQNRQRA
jgi:hypothetical protein